MRVALVMHQFPSPEHPYLFDWVKTLLECGVDLTLIAEKVIESPGTGFWTARPDIWKQVHRINFVDSPDLLLFLKSAFSSLLHPRKLLHLLKTLWETEEHKAPRVLRKAFEYLPMLDGEYDLVHFNTPQLAIRRFELKAVFRARSLVSFRGQDFSFHPDRYDRLLQEADHLHFISQFLVNQAMERGYDGSRHSLIPPMVDTEFYAPQEDIICREAEPRSTYVIFSAARLEWTKGWEFALQAVALLVEHGWDIHYYIGGDGSLRDLLVYTIDELGISERVHLLGWQSPEQVRDWMQKSDLYLLASVEEAFNNSVLQAQACGLPVVCSDAGGLPENIEDGVTGLLAKRRDAWDMADKIEQLFNDCILMNKMKQQCVDRALTFSIKGNSVRFISMYQQELRSAGN